MIGLCHFCFWLEHGRCEPPCDCDPIERGCGGGKADREYYAEEDDDLGLSAVGVRWQQEEE